MSAIEQMFGRTDRGQPTIVVSAQGITDPWAGCTLIASGSASQTVSTNLVSSGKTIFRVARTSPGSLAAATNSGGAVVIAALVDGVSFDLARATGVAVPWDEYVCWEMIRML